MKARELPRSILRSLKRLEPEILEAVVRVAEAFAAKPGPASPARVARLLEGVARTLDRDRLHAGARHLREIAPIVVDTNRPRANARWKPGPRVFRLPPRVARLPQRATSANMKARVA